MDSTNKRRVVVTGLGAVTPIGNNPEEFWKNLVAGQNGVAPIAAFDPTGFPTRFAAEAKDFDAEAIIGKREARRMDRFAQFAFVAAMQAIQDAALPEEPGFRAEVGAIVGTGIGGILTFEAASNKAHKDGTWSKVSPFFIPMLMGNAAPAHISMHFGLRGPVFTTASACASSNDAIATAYSFVARGEARAMISGGCEAAISPLSVGGFCSMKALSTRNDEPSKASRPWDKERDGFVLGEGGAVLVLEEYESARKRGAHMYAEILGFGQSADAYNLVAPDPGSHGAEAALRRALRNSGIEAADVDYINAHGTSTPQGDAAESQAIERVFGKRVPVSSNKSMFGHLLGGAAAVEGVATTLSVYNDTIPPTMNYEVPDPECTLDYVPNVARRATVNIACSNSFGFGGHNSVLVFKKIRQ
ncbi:MAG: beta-ketoacyl-[acyl-carrier-protein] synthase II [Candidatus Meridianibacter frigidus]|nr:MAG: beta-ketoacyl-[acyl-carrier-protein] synthase II [Candidatus Eremiobacteraeota bacterium]